MSWQHHAYMTYIRPQGRHLLLRVRGHV